MKPDETLHDYLVLSRGQWDPDKTNEEIQGAIDAFGRFVAGVAARQRPRASSGQA